MRAGSVRHPPGTGNRRARMRRAAETVLRAATVAQAFDSALGRLPRMRCPPQKHRRNPLAQWKL